MELKVGNEYEMVFPFMKVTHEARVGNRLFPATGGFIQWNPGCWLFEECDGSGYGVTRDFYGNAEGKVIYKVLSIAKMPSKYMDRIIFKRWLIDPEGKKYNNGAVLTFTEGRFKRDIESRSPFCADYEIDESAKN
tara:strand:- start:50 stop:454 length:405 start_codon:yes stop_codon:yes gene_type:complete